MRSSQVLVVEASAGSGKTYALAQRYVQLSLHLAATQSLPDRQAGVPIQSILAITFTNKATWAMKSRILDFLKRIALKQLNPYEVEEIIKPLGLDDNRASKLAFNLMNDVIRQASGKSGSRTTLAQHKRGDGPGGPSLYDRW